MLASRPAFFAYCAHGGTSAYGMIAAAAVLIRRVHFWDAFRPTPHRATTDPDANAPLRIAEPPLAPGSRFHRRRRRPVVRRGPQFRPGRAAASRRTSSCSRARRHGAASVQRLEHAIWARCSRPVGTLRLRRWENRTTAPIKVWFASTHAANFQPAFNRGDKIGLPPVGQRRCPRSVRLRTATRRTRKSR